MCVSVADVLFTGLARMRTVALLGKCLRVYGRRDKTKLLLLILVHTLAAVASAASLLPLLLTSHN